MLEFVIGVDGGGTATRARLARPDGTLLGHGVAGPSALGQGVENAWQSILQAVHGAFENAGLPAPDRAHCLLVAGVSGYGNLAWRDRLLALNPGFAHVLPESDGTTMLIGAHGGRPGVVVTAGTGSIAEALYDDGSRREVGGWGFPVGDEGSGAWLGMRAMAHAQAAQDGRAPVGVLSQQVRAVCGGNAAGLLAWCAEAGQHQYAQLAPLVFEAAGQDFVALQLLQAAAAALEQLVAVLDPQARMPVAICGSVGLRLQPYLSPALRQRSVAPEQDACQGALRLAFSYLAANQPG